MIPYILAALVVVALSSPTTVVTWLPPSITENERDAIQSGLEQTKQGIQDTGGAVANALLRLWMDAGKGRKDV